MIVHTDRVPPENGSLASRLSRSLKVIGTDTDRSATYDFLLTFHSNHGPISYRFRYNFFVHPSVFCALAEGVPLELGTGAGGGAKITRMTGIPSRERSLTISLAVLIQSTNAMGRQTDIQTDTGLQQRPPPMTSY